MQNIYKNIKEGLYEALEINMTNSQIIEAYGLQELFNVSNALNEDLLTDEEYAELKAVADKLKVIIPMLIKKCVKVGCKQAVKAVIATSKFLYKKGKEHKEVLKVLAYSLLMILIGAVGYKHFAGLNARPIVDGDEYMYCKYQGEDTLLVQNNDTVYYVTIKDKMPVVVKEEGAEAEELVQKVTDSQTAVKADSNKKSPLKMMSNAANEKYHFSQPMIRAIRDMEGGFRNRVYDAKHPNRKILDFNDNNQDLTIGYGHKLTKEERKKWNKNTVITRQQAEKLFMNDIANVEQQISFELNNLPYADKVKFSQGFVDGVGDLVFNCGYGNIFGNNKKDCCEFWKRMKDCRLDEVNKCINKSDFEFALSSVKKTYVIFAGHKVRRDMTYDIMRQKAEVAVNPQLYQIG